MSLEERPVCPPSVTLTSEMCLHHNLNSLLHHQHRRLRSVKTEILLDLMMMKAELMAQLEGDFKLSPEESDEEEEAGAGNTEKVSSTSESPSPPPSTKGPQTPSPPG